MLILIPALVSAGLADLEKATKNGKVVFAVVFEPGNAGLDDARSLASGAAAKTGNAVMIEIDRTSPESAQFLYKYRLSFAPVPFVMVFDAGGVLAGVSPVADKAVEDLVQLVPSPKKTEVLRALHSRKSVFITVMREGMALKDDISKCCLEACNQLNGKAAYVRIDLNDEKELSFLKQLQVDPKSTDPVTVVINALGQIAGSYTGMVETATLVSSAKTAAGGGCCPGGGGSKGCAVPK
jgi:hypothetical protein